MIHGAMLLAFGEWLPQPSFEESLLHLHVLCGAVTLCFPLTIFDGLFHPPQRCAYYISWDDLRSPISFLGNWFKNR